MNDHIMKITISEYPKETFIIYPKLKINLYYIYEAASTIKTIRLQEL